MRTSVNPRRGSAVSGIRRDQNATLRGESSHAPAESAGLRRRTILPPRRGSWHRLDCRLVESRIRPASTRRAHGDSPRWTRRVACGHTRHCRQRDRGGLPERERFNRTAVRPRSGRRLSSLITCVTTETHTVRPRLTGIARCDPVHRAGTACLRLEPDAPAAFKGFPRRLAYGAICVAGYPNVTDRITLNAAMRACGPQLCVVPSGRDVAADGLAGAMPRSDSVAMSWCRQFPSTVRASSTLPGMPPARA